MMRFGVRVGLHLAGAGAVLWIGLVILFATYEHRPDWPAVEASYLCPRLTWEERVADMEAGIPNFPRICDPDNPPAFLRGATGSAIRAAGGPIWTPRVQEW